MIIKSPQLETARTDLTRAQLREDLIELWSRLLERELRADLAAQAEASGEASRLRAIANVEPMHQANDHGERG